MVIMSDSPTDVDITKLWGLLMELIESTNAHREYTAQLHAQANDVKVSHDLIRWQSSHINHQHDRIDQYIHKLGLCYDGVCAIHCSIQ